MFRSVIYQTFFLAFLVSLTGILSLAAQDKISADEQFRESMSSFEEGRYSEAYTGFEKLRSERPDNVNYAYYTGRCLLLMNRDLDDAIEYLYPAASLKSPAESVFYLGEAHQMNYNFREAIKYYERFESAGSRQQLKEFRVKYRISVCREAMQLTSTYNQYEVMTVAFLDLSDSAQYKQIKMKGGWMQPKPEEYFHTDEDRSGLNGLMFMPRRTFRGDYAFFSGYNRSGKAGLQLFRIRKGTGKNWSDPEELKILNSEGDEILPYFDPIANDLYYASDGKGGIGGYDLYRSHYDEERDQWSEPLNLGFPVNSVRDEVLFLPGTDLGMVMFFSSRAGTDSSLAVYRVHMVEPKKKADPADYRLLAEIASLGGAAEEILAEMENLSTEEEKPAPLTLSSPPVAETEKKSAHQQILAGALAHQASSDSLRDLSNIARLKVKESDDPNDRWVWQKQIMVWEKKAADEQVLADEQFRKLNQEEQKVKRIAAVNVPETIEVDTVIDDLTVYKFKKEENSIEKETGPLEGEPGAQPAPARVPEDAGDQDKTNRFDILAHSPYSDSHPIPIDMSLPPGVYYRIQIGVFGQPVEPGHFMGISPITGETLKERGLYKYYAGKFSVYQDASDALSRVRAQGYEDAFIVAWYNGDPVSTQRAKQLE